MACGKKGRTFVVIIRKDTFERSVDALERFFIGHAPLIR
jgi:hypothetical protein